MYKLIRSILFFMDAEKAHHVTLQILQKICNIALLQRWLCGFFEPLPTDAVELVGLKFPSRVGLAAGFDKDARYVREFATLGFGFVEIGTLTPLAQVGNDRPRLFRLLPDQAIINRMGFNNDGVEAAVARLRKNRPNNLIVGGNIGKNKQTPNDLAIQDYEIGFKSLFDVVDYFAVNVSSPNTPNLRALQDKEPLRQLLAHLQTLNQQKAKPKPIFLKIAPDLTNTQLDDIVELVQETHLAGVIATNTTIAREGLQTPASEVQSIGAGGLSGKPLTTRSTEVIRYLHQQSQGSFVIIGVGGIHSAQDALEKIHAGASLVQLYTGFIYEGPSLIQRIYKALRQQK